MKYLKFLLPLLLAVCVSNAQPADRDTVSHLKGIDFLYMDLDVARAMELNKYHLQDLSDIMELHLLRGRIPIKQKIANDPDANFPMAVISVDTTRPMGRNEFYITLRVWDTVTIRRNGEQTIASIFELERIGSAPSTDQLPIAIKSQLRELMLEFVTFFRSANPG